MRSPPRTSVGRAVLPEQPAAREREEDLLVGAVFVGGRGEVPRGHLDAPQAHRARVADLAPEVTALHPLMAWPNASSREGLSCQVRDLHERDPYQRREAPATI